MKPYASDPMRAVWETSVYFALSKLGPAIKVGISQVPKRRALELHADLLAAYWLRSADEARRLEEIIHGIVWTERIVGEWFKPHDELDRIIKAVQDEDLENYPRIRLAELQDEDFSVVVGLA